MPLAAPVTSAALVDMALLESEHALGVAVEDLLHHLVLVAELLPLREDARIGHARIVAAEHDLVLQPPAHVDLEVARKILRRPARHLPVDVALVLRHRGALVYPWPGWVPHV